MKTWQFQLFLLLRLKTFTKVKSWLLHGGLLWALCACSPPEAKEYKAGLSQAEQGHHKEALLHFDRVLKRAPDSDYALKAARDGARVSSLEVKDYKKAIEYYRFLVLNSKDIKERVSAQKQVAGLYFDQLQNYDKAILEYNKLIQDSESDADKAHYKLDVARANYYQSNFFQAQSEIEQLLKLKVEDEEKFSASVLQSNIYIAQKEYPKAIDLLKKVIATYPERSRQENVSQTLAVCYEETGNFLEAIKTLEIVKEYHPQPDYVDLRIKRLKERHKNQPGAKGLRK
jgi:tetratricopeptide (TPR) repeat protein